MAINMTITTTQLAGLLKIDEGELVHALKTEGELLGVPFPPIIKHNFFLARRFNYSASMEFAEKVSQQQKKAKK